MEEIRNFISRFTDHGKRLDVIDTFTSGCCYWFAHILSERFTDSTIMYDPVANHFVTQIRGRLYDITGDVTDKYEVIPWTAFSIDWENELEKQRIIDQCINF